MGIETAIVAGLAVASTAAQAASSASAANKAAGLQQQQLNAQAAQIGTQQQINRMNGVLADFGEFQANQALDDAAFQQGLARAELGLAAQELTDRRTALAATTKRLSAETDAVLANASLQMAGLALQEREARRVVANRTSDASLRAAEDLGTLDAVSAELGLSGTTLVAMSREIGAVEGTAIGRTQAEGRDALDGLDLDRQRVGLATASSLRDMEGRLAEIEAAGRDTVTAAQRLAIQGSRIGLQDRAIERDRAKVAVEADAKRAGVTAQGTTLSSQGTMLQIGAAESNLQASMAVTNGIFSVVNSGLQVAGNYFAAAQRLEALSAGQKRVQADARG